MRIRFGGAADNRVHAILAVELAERVRQRCARRVRRNKHHIQVAWQLRPGVAEAKVGRVGDLVAHLPAPDRNGLGRQADILLADKKGVNAFDHGGSFIGKQVEDADFHLFALLFEWNRMRVGCVCCAKVPDGYQRAAINFQSISSCRLKKFIGTGCARAAHLTVKLPP